MKKLAVMLNRVLHYLSGGGSWHLLAHEKKILDACLSFVPEDVQTHVRNQMASGFFLERMTDGRINVIRLHEKPKEVAIKDAEFEDALYKVRVEVDGEKLTVNVTFYKGFIFSIETKKPTKFFRGKDILIHNVAKGKSKETYTAVIDRSEHGWDTYGDA